MPNNAIANKMPKARQHGGQRTAEGTNRGAMGNILRDVASQKGIIIFCVVIISVAKVVLAVAPRIAGNITDYLSSSVGTGNFDMNHVVSWCLLLLVMYLVGYGVDIVVNRSMVKVGETLVLNLRNRAQKKLNRMKLNYIDTHPTGDILSRVTNDMVTMASSVESTVSSILGQLILLVGLVAAMLITDWRLALIYIAVIPLGFGIMMFIMKKTNRLFLQQNNTVGELNALVSDTYSNHMLMKSYGCEKKKLEDFAKSNKRFYDSYVQSRFLSGFVIPMNTIVNNVAYLILCIVGGIMLLKNKLTIGEFQAFIFYGNMVSSPMSTLSTSMNNIQNGLTAAGRVYEFLAEEEDVPDQAVKELTVSKVKGEVEFKNVVFGYTPDKVLMHDVSFHARPGMTMAIVGPSGAGKTTLINLLLRFYEIDGGRIFLDATDIKDITRDNLRSSFGMVLQDTWIFDGTIADNIRYGKPDATMEEIRAVAKQVQCDSFIEKMSEGYETYVSEENASLSSGEKQLLAIARTMLADPKILILDEATSQVDTKTEFLIARAMDKLMENRTCFMIAHRLFTIKNADAILYMEEGDIKEVGSHSDLMKLNGKYASMYRQAASEDTVA